MNFSFNKNLARQWSRIGPRGVYGQSLLSIADNKDNIFAISADLGNSSARIFSKNVLQNPTASSKDKIARSIVIPWHLLNVKEKARLTPMRRTGSDTISN